ncbi:MAG TPA: hypothetical protein VMG39_06290 [Pseudolabrys sp.]|nr:hypothetical protein [Pseudolabrys sp.]
MIDFCGTVVEEAEEKPAAIRPISNKRSPRLPVTPQRLKALLAVR